MRPPVIEQNTSIQGWQAACSAASLVCIDVLTASGSLYRFNAAVSTVRRLRRDLSGSPARPLRRDGEDVVVLDLEPVEVGSPLRMWLELRRDGVPTLRTTNDVVSVVVATPPAESVLG